MKTLRLAATGLLLAAAFTAAQAAPLAADGQWHSFVVDELALPSLEWTVTDTLDPGYGKPLAFEFTIAPGFHGVLTVVDSVFAGDTFRVTNNSAFLGNTSGVPATTYQTAPNVGFDYDAALAAPAFSKGVFTLAEGSYVIGGSLLQSVTLDGLPLNATDGAIRLDIVAGSVPEPASVALMLAGLLLGGRVLRSRSKTS